MPSVRTSEADPAASAVPEFYSLDRAAELLDCSRDTVRRMISRGDLAAVRVGPRLLRIPADAIRAAVRPVLTAGGAR